jgi:hypothetical protein
MVNVQPFALCTCPANPQVAAAVGLAGESAARVFTEVRARKNRF